MLSWFIWYFTYYAQLLCLIRSEPDGLESEHYQTCTSHFAIEGICWTGANTMILVTVCGVILLNCNLNICWSCQQNLHPACLLLVEKNYTKIIRARARCRHRHLMVYEFSSLSFPILLCQTVHKIQLGRFPEIADFLFCNLGGTEAADGHLWADVSCPDVKVHLWDKL